MAVVFHGPRLKKIAHLIMDFEGKFESAPQLFLQLTLMLAGNEFMEITPVDIYGICTSLLMLSKDLTETIILNTSTISFSKSSFRVKLIAMIKILPCTVLTVIFRVGTVALAFHRMFVFQNFFFGMAYDGRTQRRQQESRHTSLV